MGFPQPMAVPDAFRPLVDPRLGIIRRLERLPVPPPLPSALVRIEATVADTGRFTNWRADDRAAGFAWLDRPDSGEPAAAAAAAGEAIERYCGNLVAGHLERASWTDFRRRGTRAIDPSRLALFSAAQYATPGFPFAPFARDLEVLWAPGQDLIDGAPVRVPASLVWVTFFRDGPGRNEPHTHATPYAGIAAGACFDQAVRGALLELAERDAVSLSWHRGDRLSPIAPPPWLKAHTARSDLAISVYHFPSDLGIPVLGALAEDRGQGTIALGLAARPAADEALRKAVAEACHLLLTAGILNDPESVYMREVESGAPGLGIKPWRADRAYRARYRDDWRDVWDLLSQLQLYLDPAMRRDLEARLEGAEVRTLDSIPAVAGDSESLIERFAARGFPPMAVDVTTSDVARVGLSVVRVVAPGLYGNAPAAYPYLGGARMTPTRRTTARAVQGETPCRLPLPYA